ncbi:MAG: metallophosphoesterase family protein [Pirellulales bacterium]
MRRAILSDIHGNLAALQAVATDLTSLGIDQVVCLGDSVGYGPEPVACLQWVRQRAQYSFLGNAEEAVLFGPEVGGEASSEIMAWTRQQLQADRQAAELRDYLEGLPRVGRIDGALCVHASPRSPLHEYLLPQDVDPPERYETLLRLVGTLAFVGHTHIPGAFTADHAFRPAAAAAECSWDGRPMIINAGSVGQSRDGDRRACYVVWEGSRLEFRRVEYDIATTVTKMEQVPELARSKALRWLVADAAT